MKNIINLLFNRWSRLRKLRPAAFPGILPVLRWVIALAVLAALLEPIVWRGLLHVEDASIKLIDIHRVTPVQSQLSELASLSLQDIPVPGGSDAIRFADMLLARQDIMQGLSGSPYALPFTDKARVSDLILRQYGERSSVNPVIYQLPFSESDLLRDDGIGQLPYASLYLTDVMLVAHATYAGADRGNGKYLKAARDTILAFSRFERSRWRSVGFVWNDHAVANRAGVLARFWLAYRNHPIYSADDAQEMLTHAARVAALLASGRDYNVRTNHGVMQNLALMQLALVFPKHKLSEVYFRLASERLAAEVPFLYAEDGYVLEHSAHYHDVGVKLLAAAIRMHEAAGQPVPILWQDRYSSARQQLSVITRPDTTLPALGDTELEFWLPPVVGPAPRPTVTAFGLYPLSGYAVWTFGDPTTSHSVVAWSNFRGHGHKLGDDMCLLIWGRGRGWVTNSGYWNYSDWGRPYTEGWQGSNAPHSLGERGSQLRDTRVIGSAKGAEMAFLALNRKNADGASFRRDILNLGVGLWLVIDGAGQPTPATPATPATPVVRETHWTFFPDMSLSESGTGHYLVRDMSGGQMSLAIQGGQNLNIKTFRGSRSPFAGWVTMGRKGLPAPALRVLGDMGESTASLFSFDARRAANFAFEPGSGHDWRVHGTGWSAELQGGRLSWQVDGHNQAMALAAPEDVTPKRQALDESLRRALEYYPREPNLDDYRARMAGILAVLFFSQETIIALLGRLAGRTGRTGRTVDRPIWLSGCLVGLWIVAGLWLQLSYLRVTQL